MCCTFSYVKISRLFYFSIFLLPAMRNKLFPHSSNGIDCPINSSITISFGSDFEKDCLIVLSKKKIE